VRADLPRRAEGFELACQLRIRRDGVVDEPL
jgi:hypothetical protein